VRVLPLVCVLFFLSVIAAHAGEDVLRLYSTDPFLIKLVEKGLRGSETFRSLYQRLEQADVVVHLRRGPQRAKVSGYNQFVTAAGRFRFVLITLSVDQPNDDAVALLGHELQHAVELAGDAEVTDARAYAALYERIGHRSCQSDNGRCFDTLEAGRVSGLVRAELKRSRSAAIAGAAAVGDLVRTWLARVAALADKRRRH
jgi:hypothetical protein